MATQNTSLTITFVDDEEYADTDTTLVDDEETNATISLVLDSIANSNATSFTSGTPAYVKQYPPGDFTMKVNIGVVEKRLNRVAQAISEEKVYFANVNTATLDYLPHGGVTYSWIGTNLGNPVFNGRKVYIPAAGVGVLSCSYTTLYDQLRVIYSGTTATTVLLVVTYGTAEDSLLITYTGVSTVTTRPVIITVKDYCSDEVVAGASIEVSATGYPTTNFITDADGQADLRYLTVGTTYNLKITATGYRDSDEDSLSNDSFTVTAET